MPAWQYCHGPLTRYVKLRAAHALGMLGTCSRHRLKRKPLVNDHSMHHDTCVTHMPWWMSGSLNRGGGELQGWDEYQMYEYEYKYEYLYYVWVRVQVRVLDYYMSKSPSPSTGWWVRVRVQVRVPVYDLHFISYISSSIAFFSLWKANPQILMNLGQSPNCPLSMLILFVNISV